MATPNVVATGLWLAATVLSTAIVWTATTTVAADVTDRPAPVIPHQEVVDELESQAAEVTTTAPPAGRSPVTTQPAAPQPVPEAPATTAPRTGVPQPSPPAVPPAPATTVAASPPTTAPASEPAVPSTTFSTPGGVVRVACEGFFFIRLVSAAPANGWTVLVLSRGPAVVDVHFLRSGQDQRVTAVCFGQPIRYYDNDTGIRPAGG